MWFRVCVILRSPISDVTDYSFKLCEMSPHVVSVGLLQNVAEICTRTHMATFRIIVCHHEDKGKFNALEEQRMI